MKKNIIKKSLLFIVIQVSLLIGQQSHISINEFMASNTSTCFDESGEFDDWIEIFNASDSTVDIGGFFISDDYNNLTKWKLPDTSVYTILDSMDYLMLWADTDTLSGPLHIGFRLSASGESIILTAPDSMTIIDQIDFPEQFNDISYGRQPNGSGDWFYFHNPTPGERNVINGSSDKAKAPDFSLQSGFYDSTQELVISSEYGDSLIYYSLNGSVPSITSYIYNGPISISSSSIIRARVIKDGLLPSDIITQSYFFNLELNLPTVSLVTDPSNLWGSEGILDHKYEGWEKPIYIEFFTSDYDLGFQLNGGVKIHSPDGRSQQSFRIYAREEFGDEYIQYQIFDDKEIDKFYTVILRNGGNDGTQLDNGTHIRDPFLHSLYLQINSNNAISAHKPVHVYLNGSYWGIYNLRERQDKRYIETNFKYEGDIDFLERAFDYPGNRNAIEGDWIHFDVMRQYIVDNDMDNPAHYTYVKSLMDIDNFAEYWIFEVFAGNFDWLLNNIKFWRPKTPNGRWQWVLWDLDHGVGLPYNNYGLPEWNTLDWATGITGDRVGGGSNTKIIRGLLENDQFKIGFINRFADLLNSFFSPRHTITLMNKVTAQIEPDIDLQLSRWDQNHETWVNSMNIMRSYLLARPGLVIQHILNKFSLSGTYDVSIDVQPSEYGSIELNTIKIDTFTWKGTYLDSIPIQLIPRAKSGYIFDNWTYNTDSLYDHKISGDTLLLTPYGDINLTANFVQDTFPRIIINEINYYSNDSFDPNDWVELYNSQSFPIDISNWSFNDNDSNCYIFPVNTILEPDYYLVVCQDKSDFEGIFGESEYAIGDLDFGLSRNGETIRLLDDQHNLIDSVSYSSSYPWPVEPNGAGNTLELVDPKSDNTNVHNWAASLEIGGTPGRRNSNFTSINNASFENPEKFQLFQNYPNPFNSTTKIQYTLQSKSHVILEVVNIRGQLIEILVNEQQNQGKYTYSWNAQRYSTGIYFFQLLVDNKFFGAKKGIYLK